MGQNRVERWKEMGSMLGALNLYLRLAVTLQEREGEGDNLRLQSWGLTPATLSTYIQIEAWA